MKFIILLYAAADAWPPEEHRIALDESIRLCHTLNENAKFVDASPLMPPDTSVCIKVREQDRLVTDGPFAETKEQLGGYFLIDAEDMNEAIDIAAQIPGATRGTAEIRPLMPVDGLPLPSEIKFKA